MGKTLIRVDCIDQRLIATAAPVVASGSVNADMVEFSFCPLWDGFGKTAVFYKSEDEVYHAPVTNDTCVIPHEVLADEGVVYFGVFGAKDDVIRTSDVLRYRVVKGAITEGTKPSDPTPSVYEQILSSIADLETRVRVLESSGGSGAGSTVPDYWADELEAKAEEIRVAMETAGRDKSAFLWYTDAHWPNSAKVSPLLLRYLLTNTPMNKVNFGGDIVGDPDPYNHDNIKYVYDWRRAVADLPNHHSVPGNHDLNHNSTAVRSMAYAFLTAPEESPDMVMGDGLYYYIDCPAEKTRYLYLDYLTSDLDAMLAMGQFIVDAVMSVDEGWHIVAIAHRWFQYSSAATPTVGRIPGLEADILSVFDAYNARESRSGSNYFYAQDFTDAKGRVEFCIGGHIHVDYDFTSDGGIPVIITAPDTNQERSSDDAEDSGTVGTITEAAVYGIIADYTDAENTKITVVGVGRGTSRVVGMGGTDVPDEPEEPTGGNLFNKNDPDILDTGRFNSSLNAVSHQAGQLITGYIEAKIGDTFTVTSDKSAKTNGYTGAMMAYTESKAVIAQLTNETTVWKFSDDLLTGELTIPSTYNNKNFSGTTYVRFCVAYTDIDSIVITKA